MPKHLKFKANLIVEGTAYREGDTPLLADVPAGSVEVLLRLRQAEVIDLPAPEIKKPVAPQVVELPKPEQKKK